MDYFNNGSVWYSKLESEVLLTDLYSKLSNFAENEKAKMVISWLANSFSDLTNSLTVTESDTGISCFVVHIKLVDNLVNNCTFAHDLSNLFSNDFLQAFVKPSLLNTSQNGKALADATNYFQLVCENVTQPLLIRKVVKFAIKLLPTLVTRLKSKDSELLGATLGLFRPLLEFYCEDIWHELILQHLLPMKHLLVSERQRAIAEINFQESTSKFIDLIPSSIYSSIPPETLADHFVLYSQQELQRIRSTDITISFSPIPLAKSEVTDIPVIKLPAEVATSSAGMNTQTSRNILFPFWAFKYDGTDVIHAARKYKFSESEEHIENDLFQFFDTEQIPNAVGHKDDDIDGKDENHSVSELSMPTLQLPEGPEPNRFYAQPVVKTVMPVSDGLSLPPTVGTGPPLWRAVSEDQGYFGPFLESLFQILEKWTWLDPEVIITLSDLLSVLASSRIPLITSILLDFSVVLQPCFSNFHGILHSIKIRLDGAMKKYPESFIQQEWKRATSSTKSIDEEDLFAEPGNFVDTFRSKILNSSPFAFMSKSTNSKLAKLFGPQPKEKRILNSSTAASLFSNEEEEIIARKCILRSIMFTHWMLELAAVSCWFQSRQNQRQREDDQF